MLTWENGKGFELDGMQGYLRDYSLSQVDRRRLRRRKWAIHEGLSKVDTFRAGSLAPFPTSLFLGNGANGTRHCRHMV
jgi:hypothetical protein